MRTGGSWPMDGCFQANPMRTPSLPEAWLQRGMLVSSRAGSQHLSPGGGCLRRRCPGLISPLEDLDDDHASSAVRAWRSGFLRFGRRIVGSRWFDREQPACAFEMVFAGTAGEQAVMTYAVEPFG